MAEAALTALVDGAWRTETYLAGGSSIPLDGVLLFADGWWATLYFVPGPHAPGPLASGESGTFTLDGDRLTFSHQGLFQGWHGKPLTIDQNERRTEPCDITREGRRLTIRFPSGNQLICQRIQS